MRGGTLTATTSRAAPTESPSLRAASIRRAASAAKPASKARSSGSSRRASRAVTSSAVRRPSPTASDNRSPLSIPPTWQMELKKALPKRSARSRPATAPPMTSEIVDR